MSKSITLNLEVARTIAGAFLPANPNRMRGAAPEVPEAARMMKRAIAIADAEPDAVGQTARELDQALTEVARVAREFIDGHAHRDDLAEVVEEWSKASDAFLAAHGGR